MCLRILFPFHNVTTDATLRHNDSSYQYGDDDAHCIEAVTSSQRVYLLLMNVVLASVLIVVGLFGNVLAIIVLRSDSKHKTVNFLLQQLAVADSAYLVACFFFQVLETISLLTRHLPYYPFIAGYVYAFASITQTAAVYHVVLVTVDRYIAICHPFKVTCLCTLKRAKVTVCVIWLVAALYNIPRFFERKHIWFCACADDCRYYSVKTDFLQSRTYFIVYKTLLYITFRVLLPLLTLSLLNVRLISVIKSATQSHASLTRTCPRKDSFTVVLVTVVSAFLVCALPDAAVRCVWTLHEFHVITLTFDLGYVSTATNIMLTLNSAVNCLIYTVTGQTFRKRLRQLFQRRRAKANSTSRSVIRLYPNNDAHALLRGNAAKRAAAADAHKQRARHGGGGTGGQSTCYNGLMTSEVNTTSSLLRNINNELISSSTTSNRDITPW